MHTFMKLMQIIFEDTEVRRSSRNIVKQLGFATASLFFGNQTWQWRSLEDSHWHLMAIYRVLSLKLMLNGYVYLFIV